jgi:hypothetical protein
MDTLIKFAGGDGDGSVAVRVKDEPQQVFDALTAAGGMPFVLTHFKSDAPVYVNPSTVAFWMAAPDRSGRASF